MALNRIIAAAALVAWIATSAFAADGHGTLGNTGGWSVTTSSGKTYSVKGSKGTTRPPSDGARARLIGSKYKSGFYTNNRGEVFECSTCNANDGH